MSLADRLRVRSGARGRPVTFKRAPIDWLDRQFADGSGAAWASPDTLIVADAATGRNILRNADGLFKESSDFFDTRAGDLPRPAQIEVAYGGRALLERRIAEAGLLEGLVGGLSPRTAWPDTGNRLLYELVRPVLVRPTRSETFHKLVVTIISRRVQATTRNRTGPLTRAGLRFRMFMALSQERKAGGPPDGDEEDILDLLVRHLGDTASTEQIMELYLRFLFAMTGSVAFALGWALMLALTHDRTHCEPTHLVTEALRLYPVAWLLDRRPALAQDVLGEAVTPDHRVVVCPYAIQRSPRYWDEPTRFLPERWHDRPDRSAWMPFGFGPHVCVAAALSVDLAARILGEILSSGQAQATMHGTAPLLGAALAPPRFTLTLGRAASPP